MCKEYYIGQTGDKLRNRRTVHAQQIRDPSTRQLPLSEHIDICCRTDPKFTVFYERIIKYHKISSLDATSSRDDVTK